MKGGESKAPLVLMEQVIMVVVFALAAALCVQAFVYARGVSLAIADRDHALGITQTLAEQAKATKGDLKTMSGTVGGIYVNDSLIHYYDSEWNMVDGKKQAAYEIVLEKDVKVHECQHATITSHKLTEEKPIFSMKIAWQEDADE